MSRARRAADNRRVRILFAIVFAAVALGAAPATASQGRLAVVTFDGPIEGRWYDALDASGVRIVWYQPEFAYLVHGTDAQIARAADGPGVRSVAPYTAADKLAGRPAGDVAVSVLTGADGSSARAAVGPTERPSTPVDGVATRYVSLAEGEVGAVAADPGVVAIEPAPAPQPLDERGGQIVFGQLDAGFQPILGGGYLDTLSQLGVGASDPSFVVDISDTGLDTATPPLHADFRENGDPAGPSRVAYAHDEVANDASDCNGHGTHVASTVAGYNSATGSGPATTAVEDAEGFNYGLGVAPRARIGATRILSCSGSRAIRRSFTEIASDIYARGARISNNSWGSPQSLGIYGLGREFDAIVRDAQPSVAGNQQLVEIFAAGNFGSSARTISSPGTGKNVISVGASEGVRAVGFTAPCVLDSGADSARDVAGFSSRGPTADGRLKPDIVAPGTNIVAARSTAAVPACGNFPAGSPLYRLNSGTSMAAPQVTGAAALLREWYRRTYGGGTLVPSPAMTKALLVNTATDLVEGDDSGTLHTNPPVPAAGQGWGRVDLTRLFHPVNRARVVRDQSDLIRESGDSTARTLTVADPTRPIKVTLAWSDAPGAVLGDAWVNDLDLTVVKDGVTYRGNVFSGGMSSPGGAADRRNNLENVFLPPGGGTFTVRVDGFNIAGDGVPGNGDPTDQDYALVVSNVLPAEESAVAPAQIGAITPIDRGDGDGTFEPGERIGLRVTAVNVGDAPAGAATATLDGDLRPIKARHGYPVVDIGATVEGELVGRIPGSAPCGTALHAAVTVGQPGRTLYTRSVMVPLGGDLAELTVSQTHSPRLPIPDNVPAGVASTIAVPPGARPIGELKVRVDDLQHQYVGDLRLTLTGPDGRTVVLADEPGLGFGGSAGNDLSGVVFDDAAATPIDAIPTVDATVPPGSYRPDEPLAAFAGGPTSGTWTLTAIDKRIGVAGSLGGWSLISRRFACSNPARARTGTAAATARSARVGGEVDAGGVPTGYRVEYGRTAAYGAATPTGDAGDGGVAPVAATLAGLTSATTYHYRVVALRGGVVVARGADAVLRTARAPAAPPRAFVSFAATPTRITLRSRRFALRFSGTPGAVGTLRLLGRRTAMTKPFRIAADGRASVTVKLSRRAYRLARRKRLRLRVTASVGAATFSSEVTLKARKRRR
jgi:hypothetical protein